MKLYQPFNATYNDEEVTAIPFAAATVELPAFHLQGERAASHLYKNGGLTPWYWQGIALIDEYRSVYFPRQELFSFTELATLRRSEALVWIRRLAAALTHTTSDFLDLSSGILPLWRIYGGEDGSILILSQDLGDLFAATADDEPKFFNISAWVHHNIHPAFSLCDQLTQLLYYAVAGTPPFLRKEVREDRYRHLPLEYAFDEVSLQTRLFIDESLRLSLTKQRDSTGNREPQKALTAFLDATESIGWDAENRTEVPSLSSWQDTPKIREFLAGQTKRAKRAVFWRMKGWLVITIAVSAILVAWFTIGRISEALKPPYTRFMNPQQIIVEYYQGLNALDLARMDAALAKKVKNPWAMEVTNLFVTRQTRRAYEGFSPTVDPEEWIAEGQKPLIEGSFLYGTTDVSVTRLDEHTFEAQAILYAPYPYDEEETDFENRPSGTFIYSLAQTFTLEIGKKGWYEITSISSPRIARLGFLEVETIPRLEQTLPPAR